MPVDPSHAGGRTRCVDRLLFYGHALFVSPSKDLVKAPQGAQFSIFLFSYRTHSYPFAPVKMISTTVHCECGLRAGFKKPAMTSYSVIAGGQA
jgi:hypothetical protein